MITSRVKKYELSYEEEQAVKIVRRIIDELNDEDFFEEEPFDSYCADDAIGLMNELIDNDGCAIG